MESYTLNPPTSPSEGKLVKDYMDRDLELPNEDQFVEISCSKCGDIVCFSVEDTSLNTVLCESCILEIFPNDD